MSVLNHRKGPVTKVPPNFSMADVAYNTASFGSLVRTLRQLISLGGCSDTPRIPLILLGYKERDVSERDLWAMLESTGVNLEKVAEKPGAGGLPVEIWLGKPKARDA